jgi:glycosyltransferase involved in cell wall biosynthesis
MPLVTVGLPVYNGEDYLEQCLDCLATQDFQDLKVVIHDNRSTDRTVEIVKRYCEAQPRFELKQNKSNIGALANFEKALFDADSRYFLWRAHDDLSDPNYVSALVAAIIENERAVLSASRIRRQRVRDGQIKDERDYPYSPALYGDPLSYFIGMAKNHMHQSWLYGLWDLTELRRYYRAVTEAFPHAWASDILILLHALARQGVTGTDRTTFTQRIVKKSSQDPQQAAPPTAELLKARREGFRTVAMDIANGLASTRAEERELEKFIDYLVETRVGSRSKLLRLQLKSAISFAR